MSKVRKFWADGGRTLVIDPEPVTAAEAYELLSKKDTDMSTTIEITEETVAKFAKAIRMTYGCSERDAHVSAVNMLGDPATMEKMMPRIAANLEAVCKIDKQAAGERDTFENHVEKIRKESKVSRTEAMARARVEHPEAFAAYQNA